MKAIRLIRKDNLKKLSLKSYKAGYDQGYFDAQIEINLEDTKK